MDTPAPEPVSDILAIVAAGGPAGAAAKDRLADRIYAELMVIARSSLRKMPHPASLSTTVIAHEAWMRVIERTSVSIENRRHLFGAFARAAYQIIVEHGRRRRLRVVAVDPEQCNDPAMSALDSLVRTEVTQEMDDVLQDFRSAHEFEHEVWLLHSILGFTQEQIAQEVGVSVSTVQRTLLFAKADLAVRLRRRTGA